jgi:choline kinase
MNGDVVFDPRVLGRASMLIERDQSFVTVNTAKVSDEEVKYTVTAEGYIKELSKTVVGGIGEAVGINYISSADKRALIAQLGRVDDQDYFERGLELAIARTACCSNRWTSPTCTPSRSTSPKTSSGPTSSSDLLPSARPGAYDRG